MAKANQYYEIIQNKGSRTADILIYGVIGDSWFEESVTARQFVADLRNLEKDHDRINIRINSPGGSVYDGVAIYNAIANSKIEIHTYNDGLAASMGAVILLAVKPENIHPAKNSLLMIHSPLVGAYGNAKILQKAINVLNKVKTALVESIAANMDQASEEVENAYFDCEDHWFTAQEAKDEGFYTQIEDDEAENVPKNITNMAFPDVVNKFGEMFNSGTGSLANWFSNFTPVFPINQQNTEDMDLKKLREIYNLDENMSEEDVLKHIEDQAKKEKDLADQKKKAEDDLAAANQTISDKDKEIDELKKKPGAPTATVTPDGDGKQTEGNDSPDDFFSILNECRELIED